MNKRLLAKIDRYAKGTDKEYLSKLVVELQKAKDQLLATEHAGIPPTVKRDLIVAIEETMAQSSLVILTSPDGVCSLTEEEMQTIPT